MWGCEDVDPQMWGCEDVDQQMWGRVWRCRSADVKAWRCRSADLVWRCRSADVKVWRCRSADVKVWRCITTAAFLRRTLRRCSRENHSESRLSYLFARLRLFASYFFYSTLLSFLSLLSASALLCFSSVHIVGSWTSKLPSVNLLTPKNATTKQQHNIQFYITHDQLLTTVLCNSCKSSRSNPLSDLVSEQIKSKPEETRSRCPFMTFMIFMTVCSCNSRDSVCWCFVSDHLVKIFGNFPWYARGQKKQAVPNSQACKLSFGNKRFFVVFSVCSCFSCRRVVKQLILAPMNKSTKGWSART